jgi:hypothetical protein
VQARRRESGRGAETGAATRHSNVCDALSRNVPKLVETMVANCNAQPAKFREGDAEFSGRVPVRAGDPGRGLRLR